MYVLRLVEILKFNRTIVQRYDGRKLNVLDFRLGKVSSENLTEDVLVLADFFGFKSEMESNVVEPSNNSQWTIFSNYTKSKLIFWSIFWTIFWVCFLDNFFGRLFWTMFLTVFLDYNFDDFFRHFFGQFSWMLRTWTFFEAVLIIWVLGMK